MKKTILIILIIILVCISDYLLAQDPESVISKIDFICQDCSYEQFEKDYSFKVLDALGDYEIKISKKDNRYSLFSIKVLKKNRILMNFDIDGIINNIGIVNNISNSKNVLLTSISGASGISTAMTMIDLKMKDYIFLEFGNPYWNEPDIHRSDNFYLFEYQEAANFLEKLKYDLNFFDEEFLKKNDKNPKYIFENWLRLNDKTDFGKINFINYPGIFLSESTIIDELEIDGKKFTAFFKGGVVVNDKNNNEYFVLFAPHGYYCWPTVLLEYNGYLIIGTRGEGLVIVNLNYYVLKRYDLGENFNNVDSISISNGYILINEKQKIEFKEF
jgi:hypothetical protein